MKKADIFKLSAAGIALIIAYIPTLIGLYSRWTARDTYYSHGFLVPLVSIYLLWLKRKELAKIEVKPSVLGWLLLAPGLLVHLVSLPFRVAFTSGFSLIVVLAGLVLVLLGKEYLRKTAFPLSFLAFMVPLPEVAIVNLSFRLKLLAAQIATFVVNRVGVAAIREGSLIRTAHAQLMVEDPCSGIRSLVALIALGALMAYLSNLSKVKKAIVFASSVPIAIGCNVIRIAALALVSEMYGEKAALGLFHDVMGFVVFVLAFFGLALVAKLLE